MPGRKRAAALVAIVLAWLIPACAGGAAPPSVLLITIDTLRADHLSGYGNPAPTSPALDAFMRRGTVFRRAFAPASYTAPSHASIFTGLYPSFHTVGPYNGGFAVADGSDTLATLASASGLATGAVISNPVLSRYLGLAAGFDTYDDDLPDHELNRPSGQRDARDAVDKALERLDVMAGGQFFFWLHLQDPHGPYTPERTAERLAGATYADGDLELPVGRDHSGYRAIPHYQRLPPGAASGRVGDYKLRYDAEIAFLDDEIRRLFARLDEDPRLQNTVVVITSDHGEAMGIDDFYFAHSHSVGHGQVHVPLALIGPGVPVGHEVRAEVSTRDIFPTVLGLLDISLPKEPPNGLALLQRTGAGGPMALTPLPSRQSLLAAATGAVSGSGSPVFFESTNQVGVVVDGTLLRRDRFAPDDPAWRFDNPNSQSFWKPLGERARLLPAIGEPPTPGAEGSTQPDATTLESLRGLLDRYEAYAAMAGRLLNRGSGRAAVDPGLAETLRALGYVR